jgi:glutaredoxin-related protein
MKKVSLIVGAITIAIIIGGVLLLGGNSDTQEVVDENITYHQYFWSETCPKCKNVADFVDTWEAKDVFEMEKIEINESRENTVRFLTQGTKVCNLPRNRLGVPLLVTPDGECFFGDTPIIDYLKNIEL